MQKHVNLVDLAKSFPTNIFLQNLASIQRRTSPIKFAHLAENLRKVRHRTFQLRMRPLRGRLPGLPTLPRLSFLLPFSKGRTRARECQHDQNGPAVHCVRFARSWPAAVRSDEPSEQLPNETRAKIPNIRTALLPFL